MSLSPRFRGVALAVAALFGTPAQLYADLPLKMFHALHVGGVSVATVAVLLVGAWFLRHASTSWSG